MWVDKEQTSDNEIIAEFEGITKDIVDWEIERDCGGTAYEYFVDAINSLFCVTHEQCDRIAMYLLDNLK